MYLRFITFFEGFLEHVKKTGAPLDFFSWHTYERELRDIPTYCRYVREALDSFGFCDTAISCNEWNIKVGARGSFEHAALNAATIIILSNEPVDNAEFYDARYGTSKYGSFFDPTTAKPYPTYYAFRAFGRLYALGKRIAVASDDPEIYVIGAKGEGRGEVMLVNPTAEAKPIELSTDEPFVSLLTGEGKIDSVISTPKVIPPYSVVSLMYSGV